MSYLKNEFDKIVETYNNGNPLKTFIAGINTDSLVLFGCGSICRNIISVCNDFNIEIKALCDTYKSGYFEDTGLKIISPKALKEKYPNANIVICSYTFANEISKTLYDLGFNEMQISRVPTNIIYLMYPSDFSNKYLSGYKWAYNFFQDDISKNIIIGRIKRYCMGTPLSKTSNVPIYFDPAIIRFCENEIFVDGGAYIGDTAEEFIKQCKAKGIRYHHIYSFEPNSNVHKKAVCNLLKYNNVDIINKGLWSCDTELKFYNDGGCASSSFLYGTRTIKIPVTSIDSFFANKPGDELPTFVKLDIEGSEKEALIGAKNVIHQKHPKLAICVYHKPEDIYELPKLIYNIDSTYNFTLRQCENGIYDTVLYAI